MTMPSKHRGGYDEVARAAFEETRAHALVLVVAGGTHGNGMTMLADRDPDMLELVKLLRRMADEFERDYERGTTKGN